MQHHEEALPEDDAWTLDDVPGHPESLPGEFYAQVILTVQDHAPLLADPRIARCVKDVLETCVLTAPGHMWGYAIWPDSLRFVVGPTRDDQLETFIHEVKTATRTGVLDTIRHVSDDVLDNIVRYNPVRGSVSYQVWKAGSHRTIYWSEYKLSNALYELRQVPALLV